MKKILVINPGSTTTKLAIYHDLKAAWTGCLHHTPKEMAPFAHINDQYTYRRDLVLQCLKDNNQELDFDAVIARGGLLKPICSGVYTINETMRHDLWHAEMEHACNLGGLIANEIATACSCQAFTADPVVVDEMLPRARTTGLPGMERKSIFHALNQKAVSRRYAASIGRHYDDLNLIVAHLGGGISIGAHRKGRVIDVNNALNGDGPFSPERAGTLPTSSLINLCFSGKYTIKQVKQMISGHGGMMAYVGSNDMIEIARRAQQGEEPFANIVEAMMYNIAKQIGAMYVALQGQVDGIILTGGIAYSDYCISMLKPQIDYLAPITVIPGENEMESLAYNAVGALSGELPILEYT